MLSAKSWLTEAPMRMLMNNLDPKSRRSPANSSSMAASAAPRAIGTLRPRSSPR